MGKTDLFDDFTAVSAKAWKQKIQYDLKGADYNETLVWESPEGIKVKPFYHADDFEKTPYVAHQNEIWKAGQSIYAHNAIMANEKALKAIERAAESISFIIPSEAVKIDVLLANINLDTISIYFEFQFLSFDYIKSIQAYAGDAMDNIYLNLDILGHLGKTGNWFFNLTKDHEILDKILELKLKHTIGVTMGLYQNAGADTVQQLAYALAHAHEYVHHLDGSGSVPQKFTFTVAIGSNYFFEIAKLRALRILWDTVIAEYKIPVACHIIAVPSKRNKTLYDYNTNMLRTTTECMAAVIGGANVVFNLPYDAIYHKDNAFGERMALNQLLVLKHESYLDKVTNPADGAYYVEALTQQLAEKALQLFKTLEKGGGFLKQLKNHHIQKKIKESAAKEQERLVSKKEILVGTNTYINKNDKMKDTIEHYPFVKIAHRKTLIEPIIEKRLAEVLEQKRLENE